MGKNQIIIFIVVGIIFVAGYWFFTGESSDTAEQAAAEIPAAKKEDKVNKYAADDAMRAEQEALIAQYDEELKKEGANKEQLYYDRAIAQEKLGRLRSAMYDYTNAIGVNSKSANSYYNRGLVKQKMHMYDEALQDYTKALELKPEDYRIYNTRALAYTKQEEVDDAMDDYNKSIELNPDYAQAYFNRGTLQERQENFASARDDYSSAIEKHTDQGEKSESYYRRAIAQYGLGDFKAALDDASAAIELNPRYIKAFQLRANIYDKLGNVAAAASDEATAQTLSLENLLPGG